MFDKLNGLAYNSSTIYKGGTYGETETANGGYPFGSYVRLLGSNFYSSTDSHSYTWANIYF